MMTSAQIRQSYLDFFHGKKHTIVPSSSLMPDSPNLLFTNAGMNQFVPIFLGERTADVSKWAGAVPGSDTRAADTQKCIRAGGKHNDLDDVGLDTYHHTFFEMLGNWSFGDYFKKEAIEWAWELVVERWKFPPQRVYATIYNPDKSKGDPAERDEEAWGFWAEKFRSVGLDPAVHIVNGNKKDNFWMMGETGPCGPCSELHIDLTPEDRTPELEARGATLVNSSDARCIEIWNLVFIQFNANADGSFSPLPAQHVDTGMGFERVTSIMQGTKNFTDFANAKISNYETDIFRPIFDELEKLSGQKYGSTLPLPNAAGQVIPTTEQEKVDVAMRVIADHIRTLSFAIADGIEPGNNDRNYVLRRILRRAVRYGRSLGFTQPFFYKLVDVLARTMGDVFPEIRTKQKHVEQVLKREEESFNKTLDRGLIRFENIISQTDALQQSHRRALEYRLNMRRSLLNRRFNSRRSNGGLTVGEIFSDRELLAMVANVPTGLAGVKAALAKQPSLSEEEYEEIISDITNQIEIHTRSATDDWGFVAYELSDTYGFPSDLTALMFREASISGSIASFDNLLLLQQELAKESQTRQIIELSDIETKTPTHFLGYDHFHTGSDVQEVLSVKGKTVVIANNTVCYAEMGGQVGDTGEITGRGGNVWRIANTQKSGNTWLHFLEDSDAPAVGEHVTIQLDSARRAAIQRHHTVTHLLHWALHEVVSKDATQKGSAVNPDKLTFDFNSSALTPAQVRDIEKLVNERILENATVSWTEVPYAEVRGRGDIMQFFGDKYGETVRVVQIGGPAGALNGYSMELCAGTHTRATGEVGLFRILSEAAIASGVRRIEAIAGLNSYESALTDAGRLSAIAAKLGAPLADLEKKLDGFLAQQKELEKALKSAQQREASGRAKDLLTKSETINGIPAIIANLGDLDADATVTVAEALKGTFPGVVVLGSASAGSVALIASVAKDHQAKVQAGKIIQTIAPLVGGKGGGKPDFARGGGKDATQLDAALAKARTLW